MAVGMMDNAGWGPIPRYHNLNCFFGSHYGSDPRQSPEKENRGYGGSES